jgi:hypothetical protein
MNFLNKIKNTYDDYSQYQKDEIEDRIFGAIFFLGNYRYIFIRCIFSGHCVFDMWFININNDFIWYVLFF